MQLRDKSGYCVGEEAPANILREITSILSELWHLGRGNGNRC